MWYQSRASVGVLGGGEYRHLSRFTGVVLKGQGCSKAGRLERPSRVVIRAVSVSPRVSRDILGLPGEITNVKKWWLLLLSYLFSVAWKIVYDPTHVFCAVIVG